METRQQRLIRQALEQSSGPANRESEGDSTVESDAELRAPEQTSLGKKSLHRADPQYVPRTLTAHEWEDYYREHGIPDEHLRKEDRKGSGKDTLVTKIGELTGHRRG